MTQQTPLKWQITNMKWQWVCCVYVLLKTNAITHKYTDIHHHFPCKFTHFTEIHAWNISQSINGRWALINTHMVMCEVCVCVCVPGVWPPFTWLNTAVQTLQTTVTEELRTMSLGTKHTHTLGMFYSCTHSHTHRHQSGADRVETATVFVSK